MEEPDTERYRAGEEDLCGEIVGRNPESGVGSQQPKAIDRSQFTFGCFVLKKTVLAFSTPDS